ncbi:MAG: hypothetical protein OK454_04305 [Thaumarchaeota archaeon]|nr:hypothetical protein [Nitrososphaerota archaeon]
METSGQDPGRAERLRRVAVVTVVTLVIIGGIFAFVIFSNNASSASESQVRTSFLEHTSNFQAENVTLLAKDYESSATLSWVGTTRGLGGTFNTTTTIEKFYSNFFIKITSVSLKNVTFTVQSSGNTASINGSMIILGSTPGGQSINGAIVAQADYTHVDGQWLISSETWSFTTLYIEPALD